MMSEPTIDLKNWSENRKWLIIAAPVLLFGAAVVFSFFKGCTTLYDKAKPDIYDPNESGAGFVTKADSVLALLLQEEDTRHFAVSLDSLNARYKALEFALPYSEEGSSYIEANDIRLVGIHPEYIDDEGLRNFYYNSRLPQLLRQQAECPGETFFSIRCRGMLEKEYKKRKDGKRPIVIESIKVIRPMFKVALEKNPWTGVIECTENCIFASDSTIYLTYGSSMIPLHRDQRYANRGSDRHIDLQAIMNEGLLLWTPNESTRKSAQPISYYDYYRQAFKDNTPHAISVRMLRNRRNDSEVSHMTLNYSSDSLRISHYDDLYVCDKNHSETYPGLEKKASGEAITKIPVEDGMKLIIYHMNTKEKLCEFSIYTHNPTVQLSRLTQSSTGVSRYFISENLTDLFTQQVLRGLSRHLSNRENIDLVNLSIDPLLSREFELDVNSYVHEMRTMIERGGKKKKKHPKSQVKNLYDMSLTIMDMATGEVLATPFYTTLFDNPDYPDQLRLTTRNTALMRRSIGSTFKPMVALASVLSVPSLLNFNTTEQGYGGTPNFETNRVQFLGHTTKTWAKESSSHWNGCDFSTFLGRSDDVYPVALAALALSGRTANSATRTLATNRDESSYFASPSKGLLRFKNPDQGESMLPLEEQCFTQNMRSLFKLPIDETNIDPSDRRMTDIDLFGKLVDQFPDSLTEDDKCFGLQEVAPDQTQLRMDRFRKGEDFRDLLVSWTLGQGDNMWNCIKLAEAWSRMISKRDIRASFIHDPHNAESPSILSYNDASNRIMSYATGQNMNTVWNGFLDKFYAAQSLPGTLKDMYNTLHGIDPHLMLFSKTGTPDSYSRYDQPNLGGNRRYMDVGMYTFALVNDSVFHNRIRVNRPGKGVVCVVRITRSYECTICRKNNYTKICDSCKGYNGLWSTDARDFFAKNPDLLRKLIDMTRTYIY